MRILIVCPIYFPSFAAGGVTRVAYETANALAARGHEVTVFTSDILADSTLPLRRRRLPNAHLPTIIEGVEVYYFRHKIPTLHWKAGMAWTPSLMDWIELVKSFDIIHLHEVRTYLSLRVAQAAQKFGVPYVVMPHGAMPRSTGRSALKRLFDLVFTDQIVMNAAKLIALTPQEQHFLITHRFDPEKIVVIPNAVSPPAVPSSRADARARLGWNQDVVAVLSLGRLHERKRIDRLIHAIQALPETYHLMVAGGDSGAENSLKNLTTRLHLGRRVHFLGRLSEQEREDVLAAADVFALVSDGEGQPMTVLEACVRGLPCVLTEGANVPEVARYGAGLVVSPDAAAISVGLVAAARQRELMSAAAREMAAACFSPEAQILAYEAVYHSAMTERGTGGISFSA